MGHAYTPGLKVAPFTTVRKRRRLPLKGDVLVTVGAEVEPDTVVARTKIPGNPTAVHLAHLLNLEPDELAPALLKKPGDPVKKGELLARHTMFFGLFKTEAASPVDGTVESVSEVTGQMTIREPAIPVEIRAYTAGRVAEMIPGEGAVIETRGALVQGIFGVGGECHGTIRVLAEGPGAVLEAGLIGPDSQGRVLVGGSLITREAIARAREVGAAALVAGGIIDRDLAEVLGYEIGVAITGHEDLGLTIILTEGFGRIEMAERTFALLKALEGKPASLSGATQIRAGVMRPEIIVPLDSPPKGLSAPPASDGEMSPGMVVRIIREPHFGVLATVEELPPELVPVETEARVRILTARLADGRVVTIPRANVELIEG